jgi:microcin C transport system permease protein
MAAVITPAAAVLDPSAGATDLTAPADAPLSPNQRAWRRFKRNRIGAWSLWVFVALLVVSALAEVLSNNKPLLAHYNGEFYMPLLNNPPEVQFGGDFHTPTDWSDPLISAQFKKPGNWMLRPLNHHSATSIEYFAKPPNPARPNADNWLGTDELGRDMVARLLYGFRVSILFALALTAIGVAIGLAAGAVQGYFAGRIDLTMQRLIEIWTSIPELYLLIIFASIFKPSVLLLLILLSLFGWVGLSDYTRAEFLRNRSLEFVKAARALGLSNAQIIWRHVLPNSLTPAITFLPFRMSSAVLSLVALDFLGLGVPPTVPSLGDLVRQGKANLDAWWIIFPTFAVLVLTMLLLTFIGDALRDAFDTRKS